MTRAPRSCGHYLLALSNRSQTARRGPVLREGLGEFVLSMMQKSNTTTRPSVPNSE